MSESLRRVGGMWGSRRDMVRNCGHTVAARRRMMMDFASRGGCWLRQVQITLLSACTVPQWWFRKSGGAAVQGCVEWHAGRRFQHRSSWLSGCC